MVSKAPNTARRSIHHCALRFGDGHWHGTEALALVHAALAPVWAPVVVERLRTLRDLDREALLRSYRTDEWAGWFAAARLATPNVQGVVCDSSLAMAKAAAQGAGVALLPTRRLARDLRSRALRHAQASLGDVLNHLDSTKVRESGILVNFHPAESLKNLVVWRLPVSQTRSGWTPTTY